MAVYDKKNWPFDQWISVRFFKIRHLISETLCIIHVPLVHREISNHSSFSTKFKSYKYVFLLFFFIWFFVCLYIYIYIYIWWKMKNNVIKNQSTSILSVVIRLFNSTYLEKVGKNKYFGYKEHWTSTVSFLGVASRYICNVFYSMYIPLTRFIAICGISEYA